MLVLARGLIPAGRMQLSLDSKAVPSMFGSLSPLSREQELDLHERLLSGDPVAPAQLAETYLNPLIAFLKGTSDKSIPPDFIDEAAEDAIISLGKKPASFDPGRNPGELPLLAYLKMAARRDLQNILQKGQRQKKGSQSLETVELSEDEGKYLGVDEEPPMILQMKEEAEKAEREILAPVRQGLNAGEERVLELILEGERKTSVFAKALGIQHLAPSEQEAEVYRVKDKLKRRIKRRTHG